MLNINDMSVIITGGCPAASGCASASPSGKAAAARTC